MEDTLGNVMGIFDFVRNVNKKVDEHYQPFEVVDEVKGNYPDFHHKVKDHSLIMLIVGKRGSGKTALGMKFLEFFDKTTKRRCYAVGYKKAKLPVWLKKAETIEDIPNNAIALFDEGAILFSSRESMKSSNKELSKIMAIARHKNLTLLLITQNSAMIDLNVLRLADTLLLKEPSLLQSKFERKALRDLYKKIHPKFQKLKLKKAHFYIWDDDFEGLVKYGLPEFWSKKISTSFSSYK